MKLHEDYCNGCAEKHQVNLPYDWKEGDPIPSGTTLHRTIRDPKPFHFVGPRHMQQRHYVGDFQ